MKLTDTQLRSQRELVALSLRLAPVKGEPRKRHRKLDPSVTYNPTNR